MTRATDRDRPEPSPHELALASVARHDWHTAHALLRGGDAATALPASALELLADSARWSGHHEDIVEPLERAHAAYTDAGDALAAARTALALAHVNMDHSRAALAASWFHRAEELLAGRPESREHGLLAWYRARACGGDGDGDGQLRHARAALVNALQHRDRDLEALALIEVGNVAAARGQNGEAFAAIERATAIASSGEAGLYAAGAVFCNAIWTFRCCGEWDRAHHWTESATRWVDRQQIDYFPAMCRVHRAEVLRIRGRLDAAEREAALAAQLLARAIPRYTMIAQAELGEIRRRRGDFDGAMEAFAAALQIGWDPQPGLALLLLARGEAVAALRGIERVFAAPWPTIQQEDRASLLLARTTIALAAGRDDLAADAVATLRLQAAANATPWQQGACAEAEARLASAAGEFDVATAALLRARRAFADLDAPFELAVVGTLLGEVLTRSGDVVGARIELQTAQAIAERIGAAFARDRASRLLADLPAAASVSASSAQPRAEAVLQRHGDYWTLAFGGRELRLKHGRGFDHLAALLAAPGEPRWAIELAADGAADGSRRPDAGSAGELLDAEARRQYEARFRELQQELDEAAGCADPGRTAAARAEMEALAQQLAAAVGIGGRNRRIGSAVERARQTVTKTVRAAIRRIAAVDAGLGRHLERSVRTGTSCVFDPDPLDPVQWSVLLR